MFKTIALLDTGKKQLLFLSICWAIIQGILFLKNGIVTNLEAVKYINEANFFIANGHLSTGNFYLYSTIIFLITVAIKLKAGFILVVLIQWVLNFLATFMFYKLAVKYLGKEILAVVATLLFIINIPYQIYSTYLFTESLFYSLTIIYTSYLLRLEMITKRSLILIVVLLILLSVTRPTGILFFGATAIYIFFNFLDHWNIKQKILLIAISLLLFVVIVNSMMQSGGELNFMLPFIKENIICGVDTINSAEISILQNDNSLYGLIYYIFHNATHFFELAWLKTVSFFSITRSYYSFPHNILLMLFYYPFYLMTIVGIRKTFRKKETIFFLLIIVLYWFTTILTCDDWHGRFFLTISPYLFLLALGLFTQGSKKKPA